MNPFAEGQKVVCISESFPMERTTEQDKSRIGTQAPVHPHKDEILVVAETLGSYLNFEKFNTDTKNPWWHHSRFAPLQDAMQEMQENHILVYH
jgi:hypothetical protein